MKFESEQRQREFEKAKMQLKLESLRLEQETGHSNEEREEANQAEGARSPDITHFVNGKENIHTYLIRTI